MQDFSYQILACPDFCQRNLAFKQIFRDQTDPSPLLQPRQRWYDQIFESQFWSAQAPGFHGQSLSFPSFRDQTTKNSVSNFSTQLETVQLRNDATPDQSGESDQTHPTANFREQNYPAKNCPNCDHTLSFLGL